VASWLRSASAEESGAVGLCVTWKGQCQELGRRLIISDHIQEVGKLADALLG
jgi:hypothetical protein